MLSKQTDCQQCGTCCVKGGPALHQEDLSLVKSGKIPITKLITIRKGELVYKPHDEQPQVALCELIKVCGTGRDWQCVFFKSDEKACTIYEKRPLSCRELQCWNTEAIEELVEKDTLTRFDIVEKDEPIYRFIKQHDKSCQYPDLNKFIASLQGECKPALGKLEKLVNEDIRLRTKAVQVLRINLAEELFYFGRPLFQIFQQLGVTVSENAGELKLSWP